MSLLFWAIILVILGVLAVGVWLFKSELSDDGKQLERQMKNVYRFDDNSPSYSADLITKYGFLSSYDFRTSGKLLDIRYMDEMPQEKRYITINPLDVFDRSRLEKSLSNARKSMKVRACHYRAKARKEEVMNLAPIMDEDVIVLNAMAEALQGETKLAKYMRKH